MIESVQEPSQPTPSDLNEPQRDSRIMDLARDLLSLPTHREITVKIHERWSDYQRITEVRIGRF